MENKVSCLQYFRPTPPLWSMLYLWDERAEIKLISNIVIIKKLDSFEIQLFLHLETFTHFDKDFGFLSYE